MRLLLVLAMLTSLSALALDINGRWWGDAVAEGSTQPVYVTFIQEGDRLKGTGGPSVNDQDLLTDGKIVGNKIFFDIVRAGRTPLHFELSTDGAGLNGIVQAKRNGQTVTGKVSLRKRSN